MPPGMGVLVDAVLVHDVAHGTGRPVVVLHGAGVDHREVEACVEPALSEDLLRALLTDWIARV